ncbi:hypothetical protein KAM260_54420 (plasmid) [Klebsiella pneumoniae]|nr:hypothetical protein KAM260_54420 [Klebsiella pneumoniae]
MRAVFFLISRWFVDYLCIKLSLIKGEAVAPLCGFAQKDNRLAFQVWAKDFLTTGIKAVNVSQSKLKALRHCCHGERS